MTISGAPRGRPFFCKEVPPLGGGEAPRRKFLSIAPAARAKFPQLRCQLAHSGLGTSKLNLEPNWLDSDAEPDQLLAQLV